MNAMRIGKYRIGEGSPALIIAELGINHNGDVSTAKALIDAAAESGVNVVKFQTYITEKRFRPDNPFVETFKAMELSFDEEAELWEYARSRPEGLAVMSTPFDADSAAFCAEMKADGLKVASFETTNKELLRCVAGYRLPTIVSCGQNSQEEVDDVVALLCGYNCPHSLLHCISSYPMDDEDANLAVIPAMASRYKCPIGFSDHSLGVRVAGYAVAAGACVIEKHFTLNKDMQGPDHAMSMTPGGMVEMVRNIREVEALLGSSDVGTRSCEQFIFENCRRVTD
jgi:N,N'-diacetyllegionaminate synthase